MLLISYKDYSCLVEEIVEFNKATSLSTLSFICSLFWLTILVRLVKYSLRLFISLVILSSKRVSCFNLSLLSLSTFVFS